MYSDIQAAIPLGFFLSFMIGPVFFVLLETAALKGFKAALVFDLGVILADIIFISAAYFSSLQLLENLNNQPGIYIFGGLVLFIYGATIAFKKEVPLSESPVKVTKSHYVGLFVKGFLLNFINNLEDIPTFAVHFITKGQDRQVAHAADFKELLGLAFNALRAVDHHHGRVYCSKRAVGVFGEVRVAGGVHKIEAQATEIK